jgi:hypothetical protein
MKRILLLLTFLAAGLGAVPAAPPGIHSASPDRMLVLDCSVMPLTLGKATLTLGALGRTNGVYAGDYRIRVSPYFLKNEKGRLAIVVSDESLAKVNAGQVTTFAGTATTNGKGGRVRPVTATATPADSNGGKLKVSFMAGNQQMLFEPAYHFVETGPAALLAQSQAPAFKTKP